MSLRFGVVNRQSMLRGLRHAGGRQCAKTGFDRLPALCHGRDALRVFSGQVHALAAIAVQVIERVVVRVRPLRNEFPVADEQRAVILISGVEPGPFGDNGPVNGSLNYATGG